MKSAGLDSTKRNMLKQANKINRFATQRSNQWTSMERQKVLRIQAAQAQFERQKREAEALLAVLADKKDVPAQEP